MTVGVCGQGSPMLQGRVVKKGVQSGTETLSWLTGRPPGPRVTPVCSEMPGPAYQSRPKRACSPRANAENSGSWRWAQATS